MSKTSGLSRSGATRDRASSGVSRVDTVSSTASRPLNPSVESTPVEFTREGSDWTNHQSKYAALSALEQKKQDFDDFCSRLNKAFTPSENE